ncbi:hypothetical protein EDWATA_03996 [Edwardsiella tarda ATCC 23685]|uniref:Uncharacterized protein n=1 Tax=Edwardsiella tarda ATCC 23685 TaxID=500638 RepID=D4FB25_EDWTA|nr:hypothetical protein EDWATA_03996 [Edwardsiella tarda ATCC 23685]
MRSIDERENDSFVIFPSPDKAYGFVKVAHILWRPDGAPSSTCLGYQRYG